MGKKTRKLTQEQKRAEVRKEMLKRRKGSRERKIVYLNAASGH
jgi:hypothetical protein